jgi:hypothetical protein
MRVLGGFKRCFTISNSIFDNPPTYKSVTTVQSEHFLIPKIKTCSNAYASLMLGKALLAITALPAA